MLKRLIKLLKIVWAGPNTLLGLAIGVFGLCAGSKAQFRRGCIEFHSGMIERVLNNMPGGGGAAAMTLGHTILGQTPDDLRRCREHEHVHVRQYEQWGPFFLPAYLGWSLYLWLGNRDPYLDNPFEVQAYTIADPRESPSRSDHDQRT